MIHYGQREPTGRSVTVLAEFCARNVIRGLGARTYASAVGVAADTTHGGPLEYPAQVTRLAIDGQVRTVQREARREVIEGGSKG